MSSLTEYYLTRTTVDKEHRLKHLENIKELTVNNLKFYQQMIYFLLNDSDRKNTTDSITYWEQQLEEVNNLIAEELILGNE